MLTSKFFIEPSKYVTVVKTKQATIVYAQGVDGYHII